MSQPFDYTRGEPAAASFPDAQPGAPAQPVRIPAPESAPYVTYAILGVTVATYLLQLVSVWIFGYANGASQLDWLEAIGAQIGSEIRAGQIWRLITPVLLHGSILHIGFNMYALIVLGSGLERLLGHGRYFLLYVLGAFSGNVMSFLLSPANVYSVGASTAIFGLVGAEGIFLYQNRKLFGSQFGRAIGNVIFIVAINLFLGLSPGIDNWGHIGGLLGGSMFSWFAGPLWELERTVSPSGTMPALQLADKREPRQVLTGAALVMLIFGALAMVGIFHPITR